MAEDLGGSYAGERWSYHLARPPGWLYDQDQSMIDFYHDEVFNRSDLDSNATLARIEENMRREASRLGIRLPDDSAGVLRLYAQLQMGQTTWKAIAGYTGSATPSGEGALSQPYLDVYDQAATAAVDAARNNPQAIIDAGGQALINSSGGVDATDATVLAWLEAHGLVLEGSIVRTPVLSPVPDPLNREPTALAQTGGGGGSPYSGLSSYPGMGPNGSYGSMPIYTIDTSTGERKLNPMWILLGAAVAGYLLYKKG